MDIYHIWCALKDGVGDMEFADNVSEYLGHLEDEGHIEGWRLTRRKLGLGPDDLPEFHIMVEVSGLAQLDDAFGRAAARAEPVEGLHHAVNRLVSKVKFALYRDFPDPGRKTGEERF
ncbi:MAG: hypothetical protein COW30_18735 [Rhodospirillales bacterium CG15_BIG_FIL_POST_REV_8_21_14_020_66_15]|nr:MAG: hypothetical protein COW30_18735 [Rhodospirillales bacterium CG15_BIG_FIL_POST_REV_8_21_14_020_66_15]